MDSACKASVKEGPSLTVSVVGVVPLLYLQHGIDHPGVERERLVVVEDHLHHPLKLVYIFGENEVLPLRL